MVEIVDKWYSLKHGMKLLILCAVAAGIVWCGGLASVRIAWMAAAVAILLMYVLSVLATQQWDPRQWVRRTWVDVVAPSVAAVAFAIAFSR